MYQEDESVIQKVESVATKRSYGDLLLGIASFTESSFLPILIDPFIVGMTLAKPEKWLRYTIIAGVASILGGLFGYMLGAVFFEYVGVKIIAFYHLEELFQKTSVAMNEGAFWFTLLGAFTPVPYKLTAIAGGMLHINIMSFLLASVIGRFGRFIIVAYVCKTFGAYVLSRFTKRFTLVTIACVAGALLYIVMLYLKG